MERLIDNETLSRKAQHYGAKVLKTRQISSRLKKILPIRLKEIENRYRRGESPGRAGRLALADEGYEDFLTEYVDISSQAHQARILWETHCLLISARRSMRAFRNAQAKKTRQ